MSAIAGLVRLDGTPVSAETLDAMSRALAPYGTDGEGAWSEGHVGMAIRRMRFTPEDALERQPLRSGPLTLVADARLDDREGLVRALGLAPGRLAAMPDSALVLAAYEAWGDACPAHLVGAFAFAVWDARARRLVLASDPMGHRPLHVAAGPGFFAFATMPHGLLSLPEIPRRLNEGYVADWLVLNPFHPRETFFEGIERLPPGHVLIVEADGRRRETRFWKPDPAQRLRLGSDDAYAEAALDVLRTCVRSALRSERPVASYLSGGLDSSSVAVVAAAELAERGQRLPTFTQVPRAGYEAVPRPGWYPDERPFVEAIARHSGALDVHYIETPRGDPFEGLDRYQELLGGPVLNPTNVPWAHEALERASGLGCGVVLGGVFGNFTISYHGLAWLTELLRRGRLLQFVRTVRALHRREGRSLSALVRQAAHPLIPGVLTRRHWHTADAEPPWRAFSMIRPDFAAEAQVEARMEETGHDPTYARDPDEWQVRARPLVQLTANTARTALQALYHVDLRQPLSDVRLVEFCLSLPGGQFLHGGRTRSLVRRAMAGRLPDEVRLNTRRGSQAADFEEVLRRHRARVAAEVAAAEASPLVGRMLDVARLRGMLDVWPESGWTSHKEVQEYQVVLGRALGMARFLRTFDGPR